MAELVEITYVKALFEVGLERGNIDEIYKDMALVSENFTNEPQFFELYKSPRIHKNEKRDIIDAVFGKNVGEETLNLLNILIDKRRMSNFQGIAKEYMKTADAHNNILKGTIYTATKISETRKAELEKKLSDLTQKTIILEEQIEPSVIGGIRLQLGEKVINATFENQLKEMKEILEKTIV